MSYGPLIFLSAFFALASSWYAFILTPQVQIGRLHQGTNISTSVSYPLGRPGLARQGLAVYRANGCGYCHSQQIRQTATVCDVLLTDAGTNQSALVAALQKMKPGLTQASAKELLTKLPQTVVQGETKPIADSGARALKAAGAKAELWIVPVGPDIARGWGKRRTVAEDFLYDSPPMLGSQRIGPDLANVGLRLPDASWHLRHLYSPATEIKDSVMPPYRFLFETRKIKDRPSPDALALTGSAAPAKGYEVIPKPEAVTLVAYLQSLGADAPLFVAPLTVPPPPPAETNAPSATATNAVATNAPGK